MDKQLRECPFCGGEPRLFEPTDSDKYYFVRCLSCSAESRRYISKISTTSRWNTRPPQNSEAWEMDEEKLVQVIADMNKDFMIYSDKEGQLYNVCVLEIAKAIIKAQKEGRLK